MAYNIELEDLIVDEDSLVYLCLYSINTSSLHPFLQFFLYKGDSNTLTFPKTPFASCCKVIDEIFKSYGIDDQLYSCKGMKEWDGDVFIFYDCSLYDIQCHKLQNYNKIWITLIDEIISSRCNCNYAIECIVSNLFLANPELIYLTETEKPFNRIEIPTVVYNGCPLNKLDFISTFGSLQKTENNICGYYFYNFQLLGEKDIKGIVRFALFIGNAKIEPLSLLAIEYDSVLNIENTHPIWFTSNYERHIPLTFHIIENRNDIFCVC